MNYRSSDSGRPRSASRPGNRWRELVRPSVMALLLGFNAILAHARADSGEAVRIVDREGAPVPGAVVFSAGDEADRTPRPTLAVDQRNKRFEPLVTVARPGDVIAFPNSDDIRHHVYSFSEGNAFERKLYRADEADPVSFDSPGVVALGCNIHDNMQSFVLVTEDSVHGVSDDDGHVEGWRAQIGTRVRVWHPLLNSDGEASSLTVRADAGGHAVITLPLLWEDPQERRSKTDLESLLRQFSDDR